MRGSTPEADRVISPSAYLIGDEQFSAGTPSFIEAIAEAHGSHRRPRCMCWGEGVEMYVARLGETFIVKRMPNSGSDHAPDCSSYEPPADYSGLGQVLGSAITEDPATGETTLKLDFPLTKLPGRATTPPTANDTSSAGTDGTKLSLRGLLHYLWDQAELTRWQPGFAGKRSWNTVRRHLIQAAEHKLTRGRSLLSRLYIPEVFSLEQRDAINARRLARWSHAEASPNKPQHLMLMIAEVKELVPTRYGHKAVVKHVPDQAFSLDEQLYRRLGKRFETELAMWGASDALHMVMLSTFTVSNAGLPIIMEISLMPVTSQWIPIENPFDLQLVDLLTRSSRSFIKGLRYNLAARKALASAVLTDTGIATPLFITTDREEDEFREALFQFSAKADTDTSWVWNVSRGALPLLPDQR